ncbi:MAG: HAD family hydrolase [Firmicutes bacterium]|nr:HAD family hydrolase [Bacillota bacterium]
MRRPAIIFDFDDTLVQSYPLFLYYEALFIEELLKMGLGERESIRAFLRERDIALVTQAGYPAIDCFPRALQETYVHFCEEEGKVPDPHQVEVLFKLGWNVHLDRPQPVPGARELLESLKGKGRLLVFSQGESDSQLARIRNSGFAEYFSHCCVVPLKTAESFQALLDFYEIDPCSSWMIGNSLKSDINPALAVGLNVIHFDTDDWVFDQEEAAGRYHRVQKLSEIPEIILNEN